MKFNFDINKLPKHIAFIMDGNGRWAKNHMLSRNMGHRQGVKALERTLDEIHKLGIKHASIFALSTENTKRPQEETNGLNELLEENIERISTDFIQRGLRIRVMGDLGYFAPALREKIERLVNDSRGGKNGTLNFGLNYGARAEIVRAANAAAERRIRVTEDNFSSLLYTADMPDPDLIVRTGGEKRLSNFMLYQSAYAELYFSDVLWPDFGTEELHKILKDYTERNRRYGMVK